MAMFERKLFMVEHATARFIVACYLLVKFKYKVPIHYIRVLPQIYRWYEVLIILYCTICYISLT